MNTTSAKLLISAADHCACIKVEGRATFNSSVDFRNLIQALSANGYDRVSLDLGKCGLMDSTFLGVLSGFGLSMRQRPGPGDRRLEILNANARIIELLETMGVIHLFKLGEGQGVCAPEEPVPSCNATKEELNRTCLQAHKKLIEINPANEPKFTDVNEFLANELKKSQAGSEAIPHP